MKIGQGNPAGGMNASLIEQMQRAQSERLEGTQKTGNASKAFSMESTQQVEGAASTDAMPSLDRKVVGIAERVLRGELQDAGSARKEVLHAIVDERYGDAIPKSQRRQTIKVLEQNMLDDPAFTREVDQMLILAARQVTL